MQISRHALSGQVGIILTAGEAKLLLTLVHASSPTGRLNVKQRFVKMFREAFDSAGIISHFAQSGSNRWSLGSYAEIRMSGDDE